MGVQTEYKTGEMFARNIAAGTKNKLFYKGFLIARTFNESDSKIITTGLETPETFVLSADGGIRCGDTDFRSITNNAPSGLTLAELGRDHGMVWDANNVMSLNLRWILRRDKHKKDKHKKWRLLINGLHTAAFRDFYVAEVTDDNNIGNVINGATDTARTSSVALRNTFAKYQRELRCTPTRGATKFMDPMTPQFISSHACAVSSFFPSAQTNVNWYVDEGNRPTNVKRTLHSHRDILSALEAAPIDPDSGLTVNPSRNCLCRGDPERFRTNILDQAQEGGVSFINRFTGFATLERRCDLQSLNVAVCKAAVKAGGNVAMNNVDFAFSCGQNNINLDTSNEDGVDDDRVDDDRVDAAKGDYVNGIAKGINGIAKGINGVEKHIKVIIIAVVIAIVGVIWVKA